MKEMRVEDVLNVKKGGLRVSGYVECNKGVCTLCVHAVYIQQGVLPLTTMGAMLALSTT